MSCCSSVYAVSGCFNFCDAIPLGVNATATGVHSFEIRLPLGAVQSESSTFTLGNELIIPAALINETGSHDVRVKNPDGSYYTFFSGAPCARVVTQVETNIGLVT